MTPGWWGNAPSLAARRSVRMVAKAGSIGTAGVYPPQVEHYPFGEAFMKNLTLKMGNWSPQAPVPPPRRARTRRTRTSEPRVPPIPATNGEQQPTNGGQQRAAWPVGPYGA
ncbi:hypothetical protein ACWGH4_35305, partial [Streptomyces sp. NPDC054847]